MRIEICIAKEKMTKLPNSAVDALGRINPTHR